MQASKVSKITIFIREDRKVPVLGWHAFAGNHGLEVKGYVGGQLILLSLSYFGPVHPSNPLWPTITTKQTFL